MNKESLKEIIHDFQEYQLDTVYPRAIDIPINVEKIITLIGPRRAGKTFELYNIIKSLLASGLARSQIVYINCEDERFSHKVEELDGLLKAYQELYPDRLLSDCYFFFDEIQLFEKWDRFIRRLRDSVSKHIFLTGSNAKLLSTEIATHLRGRALSYTVLPLSFAEYCEVKGINTTGHDRLSQALRANALADFLQYGGFPEVLKLDESIKIKTLQEYFNVMMYRDLVERFGIKNVALLKYFIKRLFASSAKEFSINKIFNELKTAGYKLSKDILYEYAGYCEAIFMVVVVKKYAYSIINQELTEKKVYVIDNGLYNALSSKFSKDIGKLMEQAVLHQLMRGEGEIFFHKDKFECDFIIKHGVDITMAIQVCYSIDDDETFAREINGLYEACRTHGLRSGIIITHEEEGEDEIEDIKIQLIPLSKWLLQA